MGYFSLGVSLEAPYYVMSCCLLVLVPSAIFPDFIKRYFLYAVSRIFEKDLFPVSLSFLIFYIYSKTSDNNTKSIFTDFINKDFT